jgi:predicted ATPase
LSATVAEALLGYHGKQSGAVASELAFLFEAARDWSRASDFCLIAANHAASVFANQEAAALAGRGIAALRLLPDTPEQANQELALQMMLGQSLMMAKGFAHTEVEEAFIAARDICLRLGERLQLFRSQFGLGMVYGVDAKHKRAFVQAEQCMRLAEESQNSSLLVQSHWGLGLSHFYLGEPVAARTHFEQAIAIHDAQGIDSPVSLYGSVLCRAHLARLLLYLGFADQSQRMMNQAIARAEGMRHPVGLADALSLAAHLAAFHHHPRKTQELAAAITRHSQEHGLPYYSAIGMMMSGWSLAMQDKKASGIDLIREGLESYLATGTRHQHGYYLGLMAEALGESGRDSERIETLREALGLATQSDESYYEAELHRLTGEALLKVEGPSSSEAELCFQKAVDEARRQSAKSLELRAVMSLARLWAQLGRRAEAHRMLGDVYDWFTEGSDTPDLRNARTLTSELSV